jgi:hypothetical protein
VADQPQPLLRSEVQARWRSAVAADGCAAQMDGLPVPTSGNRATAAAPLVAATGSGGGSSDTDSEQEEVPDMAAAPRGMDRKACIAELKVWKLANGAPSFLGLTIPALTGKKDELQVKVQTVRTEYLRKHRSSQDAAPQLDAAPAAPSGELEASDAAPPALVAPLASTTTAASPSALPTTRPTLSTAADAATPAFTGASGSGFSLQGDGLDEEDEEEEEEDEEEEEEELGDGEQEDGGATGVPPAAKKQKKGNTPPITNHERARLCHVVADDEMQHAVGMARHGRDKHALDTGEKEWDLIADKFNSDTLYVAVDWDSDKQLRAPASPRFDTRNCDPNAKSKEPRTGEYLRKQWVSMKKVMGPYFQRWKASGEGNKSQAERSISDFLGQEAGRFKVGSTKKGQWIKYAHLMFKGNNGLWEFAMKPIVASAIRESGASSSPSDGSALAHKQPRTSLGGEGADTDGNGGSDGGRASPAIDYTKLETAMTNAGETEADRRSANAMERIAATQERGNRVQELDSLLARFPALPDGAVKTMVQQRIAELFAASAAPPTPTPVAPSVTDTENVQDAGTEGGAE